MTINFPDLLTDGSAVFRQTESFFRQSFEKKEKPLNTAATEKKSEKTAQTEIQEKLKSVLAESDISLDFSRDEQSGVLVIKMVDNKTGEAIRQFPSDVSLKLSALFIKLQGQFVDKEG